MDDEKNPLLVLSVSFPGALKISVLSMPLCNKTRKTVLEFFLVSVYNLCLVD